MASPERAQAILKELAKHANRDDCYECKKLLRCLGAAYMIKPPKKFEV